MPRFPLTLWRATFFDLLKLVSITTAILVLVIALGAAVKPLSDGALQPGDLPKFILFASVPMLAYALPFAGGFASTLVFYRIANENEAVAAHAGGISHRTLMAPAFALALTLTACVVGLNEEIIPRFLSKMQRLITVDVARQIFQSVDKGQAVQFKSGGGESRMMIYADSAQPISNPTGGATDQIVLSKFAFVELDKAGDPIKELTAALATIWLLPANDTADTPQSLLYVHLEDVAGAADKSGLGTSSAYDYSLPIPNTFADKVAFFSWRELRELSTHPERISWIEAFRLKLAHTIADRQFFASMQQAGALARPVLFKDSAGNPLTITTGPVSYADGRWTLTPPRNSPIRVERTRASSAGTSIQTITAESAILTREPNAGPQGIMFGLQLSKARISDSSAAQPGSAQVERSLLPISNLTPSPNPVEALRAKNLTDLLAAAQPYTTAGDTLDNAPADLAKGLLRLNRLVLSKQHERMAMALSCTVMVLTGAVTALLLSRRLPLTVYLFTFLPALATIVTISGGQQMVQQVGPAGLILLWSGVGALGVYTLCVFGWLARH